MPHDAIAPLRTLKSSDVIRAAMPCIQLILGVWGMLPPVQGQYSPWGFPGLGLPSDCPLASGVLASVSGGAVADQRGGCL